MFKKLKAFGKAALAVIILTSIIILFIFAIPILLMVLAGLVVALIGYIIYKINSDPEIKAEINKFMNSD